MATILETVEQLPVTVVPPRGVLVAEGERSGKLFVLKSGNLDIVRDGSVVATLSDPGEVVGEMSALLDLPHTATVRARAGAEVYIVDDPDAFLDARPALGREIARALALRLHRTTAHLVDLRARAKDREDQQMLDKIFALLK